MTTRQEKVNSLLQKVIAEHLREQDFEDLKGLVTITGVDVSPDLEYARVFFSVIGQEPEEVTQILKKNIYQIQGWLNRKLTMRKVPRVTFLSDYSGEYAGHIGKLLKDIHNERPGRSHKAVPGGKEIDLGS